MYDFNWNKAGEEKKATGIEITQRKVIQALEILLFGEPHKKRRVNGWKERML